jgi:hypothetical protein
MALKEQTVLQSFLITVASGLAGGVIREQEIELDSAYDEAVGVEAHQVNDGGTTDSYYQIGVADTDKAYVEIAHKNAIMTSSAVDQRGKMRAVNIPIRSGKKLKVKTYWPTGNLSADLRYELVFTLKRTVAQSA